MVTGACRRRVIPALVLVGLLSSPASATSASGAAQPPGETVIGPRGDAGLTGSMPGVGPATQPAVLWEVPSDDGVIEGMAIRDGSLFFATRDPGLLRAVDRATGAVMWTTELGPESSVSGPEVAGDVVVIGVWAPEGNAIVAVDAATGAERWRVPTANLPSSPTHVDGTVYVPAEGGLTGDAVSGLYAVEASTGEQRWFFEAPEALDLGERVAVSDGIVVARARSLEDNGVGMYAIDAATGQSIWTFTLTDETGWDPVVRDGTVLVTDLPYSWALDLRTGATRWDRFGPDTGGGVAIGDAAAYFGHGDAIQAVSLTEGSTLWSAPVPGVAGAPVIAGGIVYSAVWKGGEDRSNHSLHAFDSATGAPVWSLEIDYRVDRNQPLAHDGVLYVDTNDAVVAFAAAATPGQTTTTVVGSGEVPPATQPPAQQPTGLGVVPPATQQPTGLGPDAALNALAQACFDGDMAACDQLYSQSEAGSLYEQYGDTCAGRQPLETGIYCADAFGKTARQTTTTTPDSGAIPPATQQPTGLGDDQALNGLAEACYDGDMAACDDLYGQSDSGSLYEQYGDTCAGRQPAETGRLCADVFEVGTG